MRHATLNFRPTVRRRWAAWSGSFFIHGAAILAVWWYVSAPIPVPHAAGERIFVPAPPSIANAPEPTRPAAAPPPARAARAEYSSLPTPPPPTMPEAFATGGDASPGPADILRVPRSAAPIAPAAGTAPTPFGAIPRPLSIPPASVLSVVGDAPSVAYVCDASGSMVGDRMAHLKAELRKAIASLQPIQAFTIIFFKQGQTQTFSARLVMATGDNRRGADAFLQTVHVQERGDTDPVIGLNQAFDAGPAVIYLLTDGDFPDDAAVQQCIARRNPRRNVKINTIAFLGADTAYESVLKKIAAANGGTFKRVTREELQK